MQVRNETSPEDVGGMHAAAGILTARGGMTSHAAVVARGWGKCCVSGCSDIRVNEINKVCWKPVGNFMYITSVSAEKTLAEILVLQIESCSNLSSEQSAFTWKHRVNVLFFRPCVLLIILAIMGKARNCVEKQRGRVWGLGLIIYDMMDRL